MSTEGQNRTGQCLCGGVKYSARSVEQVLQCHCENCRRVSGNFVAGCPADTTSIEIDDDGLLNWWDLGYAKYGFCRRCGSSLFYRAADREHVTSIMVGTLDDSTGLTLQEVWFADEAQSHNTLPDGVPHHERNG